MSTEQSSTLPGVFCAYCASMRRTCCQICDIFVTRGDIARITACTGQADFWERRVPQDPSYLDQSSDPYWAAYVFAKDGTRPVLARKPNNDCIFLGPSGCLLPVETRPLVCRLYPYTYDQQGLKGLEPEMCPSHGLPEGADLLYALGMDDGEKARLWHEMLYREIGTEPQAA